jgi:hypothetical protein
MTQSSQNGRVAFSHRPASALERASASVTLFVICSLLLIALLVRPDLELEEVVPERDWLLETAQVWLWLITAIVAAVGCLLQPTRRGLLLLTWIAALGLFAGLRELDLHVLVNPKNIHLLGLSEEQAVRFRSRWWLEGQAPLSVRLGWAAVFLVVGTMLVAPFALARYPWLRQLRRKDLFPWLIAGGFLMMFLAFLLDDVIGRPLQRAGVDLDLAEESTELLGGLLIFFSAITLALRKVDLCLPGSPSD